MAVAQGSGTGGTTKKKPDDPYFDSDSPAGSNFKQAKGTSSSTGFKDKQTTADPYFSNTSPAGSTMSSDKSTWRTTNSGWNVPPSGSTAAQGGGTYNREAAAQSRSGSTVRDSNRDRGTTGNRASINTTVSRDRGQEIASPQLQGYDSPLVRLTREGTAKETWTPSTARNAEASVQFSSPLWNWVADKAERGVGYLNQVQQDYEDSGIKRAHDERAADREAWYEDQVSRGGWRAVGANIAAPVLGLFQATEMAQDAMLATQMPEAPTDWQAREVASIMGRPAPNTPEQVTVGQALSAAGEATNKKFNVFSSDFEGPLPQYSQQSQYSTLPLPAQEYSGDWYSIFSQSIEDSRSVNERYQSLSPADQFLASPVYNMLHSSGPQAQEAALTTVLTQAETVQNYQQQADAARARGDMLKAASYAMAAESLKAKTPLDIVEENKVWSGDLMAKIIVPDPLDIAIGPAVEATQASVARVRAMLASPMTEATVEVATQALQTALEGADELAKIADASGDLFRFWAGKKNAVQKLFENTRATEAERVAANFSDSLAVVLPRAQTADEAKVIITDLLNGTLFEKNPDIGRNPFLDPQFLTDLPIIKQAEDLLLNAKTLNDPEGYNPLLVLGELEDKIWRKSRQLFGLDNADLPTGTVRMKTVKDGKKYVVQWLGADDTVLRASDKLEYKAAKALASEQNGFIQEGLSKPWYLRVGDWQRAVLSTMYLNLAPRHWIRNAIAAYSAMGVDDALNITKLDNMSDHVLQLYGGGAPSTEWGGVLRGMGQNPVAPETGTKGFWTFGGRWKKGNPIAWVDNLGNKIWTSTTEVPIGNGQAIPVGEEAFRLRIAYGKMMEYLNHGVDVMLEDFASGMRDLGIAPEVVSSYAGQFSDLARRTNRTEIFEQMRQAIGSPELAASLEEIGIDATRTTPQGRAALMQILNESSLNDLGTLEGRLLGWLKQETQGVSEILSQVPPQPGRQFFTAMDMAQDAADGIETLTYAAVKGGMDPGEARIAAETLWRGVIDNEKQAMQAVQDLISNTNGTDAFDRAFLFFQKIEDEKRNIRLAVDRLNRNAARSAREGANIWAETQAQVSKLWSDYASNVQTWLDDISNATVATRAAQPLGVGEIVRLNDGTEVAVKQVLQENDVTSYVVTPRETGTDFVERTVNAADIVVPANATGRAQSMTDDLLQKYLAFDAQDNARLREMGVSSSSDDVTWSKVINAGREYVDNALNDALLFFRRSPSQEFFDHLVSAEKEVNETGMWVAAQVSRIRDDWFTGKLDRAAYYEQSSRWWNEFFEFGHQRFRFATNAGLRATLGEDAVNALAAVPTYHVPPTPEIDDIRRMAALVGRATDKGDRRLVNSINSHLNTSVKRLEELTPDQRRAAFQFYMQEAQTTGVDIPSEWYRWRNPNTSMVTGFGEGDDFAETMWKLESGRVATGNVQTPTYGEVARYELSNSWDVVRRVLDNAERLLTPRVNDLDNQQKAGTIRLLNNMLRKWEDTLYNAAKAGEEATAFAMLNYRDRKNIDTFLSAIFPYHYYATRAPLNWLRRTIERPSIAYNVWLANQAIRGENQQFNGPMRAEGSIPNPFVNLASNVGAQGVADALPSRIYSPLEYAIPYSIWNDFINPEEGQTRLERAYLNVQKFTPGFQPIIQGLGATIFDAVSPRTDDWSRLSDYQLGDYLPLGRMAGYLAQGISGNQIGGQLGDKFDFGRIGRSIRNGIAAGDYDSYYGNLALGQIENQMRGYTPIPELQDPKTAAEVQKIVESGVKAAGWERFMNLAMGYSTGFPGQDVSAIEKELRDYQQEYYGLGYGYENTMGSRAAQDAFKEKPLSSGVPYGEANAYYSDLYGPVGSEYGPKAVQAVTKQFNQERSAIYDEMGKATVDFLLDNPTATKGELNEFKQQYYAQVDALKEKYPSADTEGDARYAVNGNGMNPFERAQAELENVLRYEPPGKPEYPGDGASPKVMDDYYSALGEWKEKRLNVVERVFEQWAQGDDTQPGAADADYVGQRTVMGRYAQELVDTYELRFADPVEIEWSMRNQLRSEAVSSSYAAQKQTLTEQFGEDGYALFRAFQLIPEGENGDYWTDAHDKFIEEHPEVQEMMIYDRSPEVHDHMVSMGGDRVFEALAMYPGGGTKSQKNQWKSRYGREKEAVYWYFGVNDSLQSSTSGAYAEGDRLAADWMNYTGPRPVGSDRQPIGGITRAEYQQGADPYFQNDYTGMRPQDAVAAGQQVAAINTPTQSVMSRNDLQGVIDRAQQPPNRGMPGLTAPPAGSAAELQAAKVAADAGRLMEYLDAVKQAQSEEDAPRQQFASGYGYGGYYYRGRYYRRRSYRRRSSRRRSGGYRRYSRGGRRGGYGGGYGGGGGGGYSTAEEQQPLYLRFDGPQQTYAREFATWLYPQSNNQTWRPTGINSGFTPPRGNVAIRPWRRINVRA